MKIKSCFITLGFLSIWLNSGIIYGMLSRVTPTARQKLAETTSQELIGTMPRTSVIMPSKQPDLYTSHTSQLSVKKNANLLTSQTYRPFGSLNTPLYRGMLPFEAQKSSYSEQKKGTRFDEILKIMAAGTGLYLLTKEDRQALAEEAISLDRLKKLYGINYEKSCDATKTYCEIVLTKDNQRVGEIKFSIRVIQGSRRKYECEIRKLWVDQKYRQRGIGATLLHSAIKTIETEGGCNEVYVVPEPFDLGEKQNNDVALERLKKYYGRFGFKKSDGETMRMKLKKRHVAI
ncbi:MAG: GNAT family N-acetyltransferase [Candidatus Babeliaceae bacterium]